MVIIGKIFKWLGLALLIFIVWIFMRNTIVNYLVTWTLQYEGMTMQKNEWREFGFDDIEGEKPYYIFGGTTRTEAIGKYRLELMYPFDGKVGFVGGSDRALQNEECFKKKDLDNYCAEKKEQSYIFRTIDDGKTFTRQTLGHGIVKRIKKIDNSYFINIEEEDTKISKTFRSDDLGESWKFIGDFYISELFEPHRFVYVTTTKVGKKLVFKEFYTKDGAKTSQPLDEKLLDYEKKSLTNGLEIYKGNLVFLIDETLVFVNIDTLEEKRTVLKRPPYQLLEQLIVDKESGELLIYVKDMNAKKKQYDKMVQSSIWYPLTNELVKFDKDIPHTLLLRARGNYIGGLLRYRGLLTHMWTMDKGKTWKFEMLSHYFWDSASTGYGNGRIYMNALVQGKEGVKKGSYLIMGKVKR
jgi:hypothetical protein